MSGDARDFNNMETRAVIKFFFPLQGKAPNEIHAILIETLGENAPSYATVKNCVARFKRGDFATYDAPRPGRPKTVTNPEIIDQIPGAKIRWESSRLDFLGSRRHRLNRLSSKGPNNQRGVLLISAGVIEGHFEGKPLGKVTKGVLFLHDNAPLTGHL